MKKTIQTFLDSDKVAIAGASPNKDNFGRTLMVELQKLGKDVFLVNPRYGEIEGKTSLPTVKDLPGDVENLILAVPPELTEEIVEQSVGSGIKRVWMVRGIGKGAYSEKAYATCRENKIEVVYGFCPLMFYGEGMHKFHLWLRKTFGKIPGEYQLSSE
ncbi:MAG: CoA-binding protein [Bacteroidales bacterium]|nr:CoA-binding protein [Bacteroidales bacterium]